MDGCDMMTMSRQTISSVFLDRGEEFRMKQRILLIGVGVLMAACAASGPLPEQSLSGSVVDYSNQLVSRTTARTMDRLIDTVHDGEAPGYRWLKGWWCPRHPAVGSAADVAREFERLCTARGGVQDTKGFCRQKEDSDEILFVAKVSSSRQCSGGPTATLNIVEPTVGRQDELYLARLRTYGYKTAVEEATSEAHIAAQREARAEQLRLRTRQEEAKRKVRHQELLQSLLGTRICQDGEFDYVITTGTISAAGSAPGTLIGQLDGFSEEKTRLRFRVLGSDIPSRHGRVAPFVGDPRMGEFVATPGAVYWDRTKFWTVCE